MRYEKHGTLDEDSSIQTSGTKCPGMNEEYPFQVRMATIQGKR